MKIKNKSKLGLWITLVAAAVVTFMVASGVQVGLTQAQETSRPGAADSSAHVVVQYADGTTAVRPISWTGTISRVAALELAGFEVESSGDAVCSIEGEGCPATECFCAENLWAQGTWAGTTWDGAAWPPPVVLDGDVVAFRDGTQSDYSDWGLAGMLPGAATYVAASDALEWMRDQQQPDGSYKDSFGKIGASARALVALGSAGYDPAEWGNPDLLSFLTVVSETQTAEYAAASAAGAGKLALGAVWTQQPVEDFAGINLPISITTHYSATTGVYGAGSGDTAWAVLGLSAAGEAVPAKTVEFLKRVQNDDGGWAWNEWGATSETQHTAACMQALLAAGEPMTSTTISQALAFLKGARNADGGYPYTPPGKSDVSSAAYALQGVLSAGEGPSGNWCTGIQSRFLLAQQKADGSYPSFSPLYATQETIPALMYQPYGPRAAWSFNCYPSYLPLAFRPQ
jgi:hypothetical protein